MTINGTLSDIGLVSLLQFPNSSGKTGMLTVISIDGKADFYYRKGELVHARYGKKTGKYVLVDTVDWNEGRFTFETGMEPEETTIHDDLHNILIWALRERDDKKRNQDEEDIGSAEFDTELSKKLDGLLKSAIDIQYIGIFSNAGQLLARSNFERSCLQEIEPFMESVTSFISSYPGKVTGKALIEASDISIAIEGIDETETVVISTGPEIKFDKLSMVLFEIVCELRGV
ncbi:MAG: DUF4388 domain-containing protein [Candidatus Aegiribacteria sp.]|nr:DUF4388 domain-containing protein [Candidatus Aegiribacteria sp.]